jgi:DUF1009 family protein
VTIPESTGAADILIERRLREAIPHLDSATDCLSCAHAAVALESRECAEAIIERIRSIAGEDTRFAVLPEFLVIRDLALAIQAIRSAFGDLA